MKVSKVLSDLAFGKLSNQSMAEAGDGTINVRYHPKLINCMNEALIRLYTRFIIKEKDLTLELVESITNYHLLKRFAESNQPQPDVEFAYIKDLDCEAFQEDVLKVLAVYGNDGRRVPLNDPESCTSVFTPQENILQAFPQESGVFLGVQYQAKHPELTVGDLDQEVDIPPSLYPAFLSYIAYMVFSDMGSQDAIGRAQEHMAVYESICSEAETRDILSTSLSNTNVRFSRRGWV